MSTGSEQRRRRHDRLRALLSRQDGVISLAQALELGVSHESVRRRVAAGDWERLAPRVYQDTTHTNTPRARVRAALLSVGDHAVLAGRSAAWWWGLLDAFPVPIEILLDEGRRPRPRPGVAFLTRPVRATERTVHRGLLVTAPVPTVLDACARVGVHEGSRLMDRALQERKVTEDALRRGLLRRYGRHGTPALARLMALAAGGAVSEAERLTHRHLRAAGIGGWLANAPVTGADGRTVRGDLVFHAERVVVEVDGWAYHRGLRPFLLDGPRQTALVVAGWVVLRTHWYELTEQPEVFVAHLRAALAARS